MLTLKQGIRFVFDSSCIRYNLNSIKLNLLERSNFKLALTNPANLNRANYSNLLHENSNRCCPFMILVFHTLVSSVFFLFRKKSIKVDNSWCLDDFYYWSYLYLHYLSSNTQCPDVPQAQITQWLILFFPYFNFLQE